MIRRMKLTGRAANMRRSSFRSRRSRNMTTKPKRTVTEEDLNGYVDANEFLEELLGPLTFGRMLWSIRMCDELSQTDFAEMLGVGRSHICDVEKGRKVVSPERAAAWAKTLGYSDIQFVRLALQDQLDKAGVKMNLKVEAA
jgi:plasmid maintenance system antidote protein VapI